VVIMLMVLHLLLVGLFFPTDFTSSFMGGSCGPTQFVGGANYLFNYFKAIVNNL